MKYDENPSFLKILLISAEASIFGTICSAPFFCVKTRAILYRENLKITNENVESKELDNFKENYKRYDSK